MEECPELLKKRKQPMINFRQLLACLWAVLMVLLAMPAQASTLDALGAQVTQVRFFESPPHPNLIPLGERTYGHAFAQQEARYIWFELHVQHPNLGSPPSIPIFIRYLRQDGSTLIEGEAVISLQAGRTNTILSKGAGWDSPGNWPAGTYTLHVFDGNGEIAVSAFTIASQQSASPAFSESSWITAFYIAYWDRAPDPAGHAYWLGLFNQGTLTIPAIAENFALTDEAKSAYPYFNAPHAAGETQVNNFVRSVFRNLLDRDVPANDSGVLYWVGELRNDRTTPGAVIGNIIHAAMQAEGSDWQTILAKVQAAEQAMENDGEIVLTRVQQAFSITDFMEQVNLDPALSSAYHLAIENSGTSDFQWAGLLEDDAGVRMIFAEMDDASDSPVVLVRHCKGNDCVSAVQLPVNTEEEIVWLTPDGQIPVRTAQAPFQLRLIDESDPDGSAVIAPVENIFSARSRNFSDYAYDITQFTRDRTGTPTNPNRQLHLMSLFGRYFTLQGPDIDPLKKSMQSGGFPKARTIYNFKEEDVDRSLSTLKPSDAVVWLTHGDLSRSQKKVVGLTVGRAYWGAKHYPASRMAQQLAKNSSGGPGIVILAGCKTADLIPVFDDGRRVVLGFNENVMPGVASTAVRNFFTKLSEGGTLQEALDAANASIKNPKIRLVVNSSADLSQRLVDVGAHPGDTCSTFFSGSWQGSLTVTLGSDRLPTGTTATYPCGRLVMSQGDDEQGMCKGCWVTGSFVSRNVHGCAGGSEVTMVDPNDLSFIMQISIVNKDTLNVTNFGKDSAGVDITRSGTFTKCN